MHRPMITVDHEPKVTIYPVCPLSQNQTHTYRIHTYIGTYMHKVRVASKTGGIE